MNPDLKAELMMKLRRTGAKCRAILDNEGDLLLELIPLSGPPRTVRIGLPDNLLEPILRTIE